MRHCSILRPSALLIRAVLPLLGIALAASPVAVQPAAAAEATMFDGDRAQRALEAVEQQAGRKLRVLSIAIKTGIDLIGIAEDLAGRKRGMNARQRRDGYWTRRDHDAA